MDPEHMKFFDTIISVFIYSTLESINKLFLRKKSKFLFGEIDDVNNTHNKICILTGQASPDLMLEVPNT